MPKRIIHGEGVWRSSKLRRVNPIWVRSEYANLIPLSLANGVFEADPERIWSEVYSFNRPDMNVKRVRTTLKSFNKAGLLFLWDHSDHKSYGWWTGIDKPGRLPGESRRGTNETIGPTPPMDSLRKYMDANGILAPLGFGLGTDVQALEGGRNPKDSVVPCKHPDCIEPTAGGEFVYCRKHVLSFGTKKKK